jgi:hypothetical protein
MNDLLVIQFLSCCCKVFFVEAVTVEGIVIALAYFGLIELDLTKERKLDIEIFFNYKLVYALISKIKLQLVI